MKRSRKRGIAPIMSGREADAVRAQLVAQSLIGRTERHVSQLAPTVGLNLRNVDGRWLVDIGPTMNIEQRALLILLWVTRRWDRTCVRVGG